MVALHGRPSLQRQPAATVLRPIVPPPERRISEPRGALAGVDGAGREEGAGAGPFDGAMLAAAAGVAEAMKAEADALEEMAARSAKLARRA